MSNILDHTGGKSFKNTETRKKKFDNLDLDQMNAADAIDELLDRAETLEKIQEEERKKIREEREEIRDREELLGLS